MIEWTLSINSEQLLKIQDYIEQVDPYKDGKSAEYVLAVTEEIIKTGVKTKTLNLLRKYKIRKALNSMRLK